MLKAIIIEDELRSIKLLENLLATYCTDVQIQGTATTIEDGYKLIVNNSPDVIFLDIEMQSATGFDLLSKFNEINFEIIFTTAFEHYAIKAIKFCALDYLLKPIDIEELKTAIVKVHLTRQKNQLNKKFEAFINNMNHTKTEHFQIALPSTEGLNIIRIQDIIYLKSDRQYTIFYLNSGEKIITSKNLGEYEELLLEHNFFRVHHSAIINLNEVKKYMRGEGGVAVMSNGEQIEVSKRKKEAFIKNFSKK
ncbi:MAG: response regulator transcription factor [Saprospiraceae bacterium]|nr:response regulator transcription factor [Saprospiraceae bacterium]